ncbi:PepSY-associated TM helix domain-containing protein [candidate division KSB1 bacterium]
MKWRKLNNILHRDIGYICVGLTIIYAVSGVAVNHVHHWNPDFSITAEEIKYRPLNNSDIESEENILKILTDLNVKNEFQNYYMPDEQTLKIFIDRGSLTLDIKTGAGLYEYEKDRIILREMNLLHLNEPKKLWTYVADLYAVALFLLAITGIFVLKGKKGFAGRGKWFILAGIVIPVIFLFYK